MVPPCHKQGIINMDMKSLLEKLYKFAGEPEQKPGDQVRGTDVAKPGKDHPFKGKLVGASESSIMKELKKESEDKALEWELAEAFKNYCDKLDEENLGVHEKRPAREGSRPAREYTSKDKPSKRYTKVKESLRRGEYHQHTVTFDDGTKGKINVPSDEFSEQQIKDFYAKQGKKVVKVDWDYSVKGEPDSWHNDYDYNRQYAPPGIYENAEQLNVGDDVVITGPVEHKGETGVIDSFGKNKSFVVVNLYNHGKKSFHSSDVSYNDYADSDAEEAEMYDRDPDFRKWADTQVESTNTISEATEDEEWNGWVIRYETVAKEPGKHRWMTYLKKRGPQDAHSGVANSAPAAMQAAKDWILTGGNAKEIDATKNITIDFNAKFVSDILNGGRQFFAKILPGPTLVISADKDQGFKTTYLGRSKEDAAISLPSMTLSPAEAQAAGLKAHGRYMLGDTNKNPDGSLSFPLIYQSTVQSKSDKLRMSRPGLTVAMPRSKAGESIEEEITVPGTAPDPNSPEGKKQAAKMMQGLNTLKSSLGPAGSQVDTKKLATVLDKVASGQTPNSAEFKTVEPFVKTIAAATKTGSTAQLGQDLNKIIQQANKKV